ncbi:MAG: replication factor C small subunit [Candidatus Woesearchaeota archaeon]
MEEQHAIWVEKFRPQTFSQIRGQTKIVQRLKSFVEQKNIPHLLFSGPAGVGKTTTSLVIAKELFGENYKSSFLELNASDERGIDVIRTKVKDFARTKAIDSVPFKIIYLDECDALTKEAQQALRRTMENYTTTTRFILSCNYASKIIDPIQSRCTVFRFKPLEKEDVFEMIEQVSKSEQIIVEPSAKEAIFQVTQGDGRRVKNLLQSCSAISKTITEDIVFELSSVARPQEVIGILNHCLDNEFLKARTLLLETMLKHGLSGSDIIKQIQQELWNLQIPERIKIKLIDRCGDVEFRMTEGSDEYLQLEAFLAYMCLVKKE